MKPYFKKLFSALPFPLPMNMQPRERMIVLVGAVALVIILLLQIAVFPILDRRSHLQKMIATQSEALLDIQLLKMEYDELTAGNTLNEQLLKQRKPGFNLYSFLESLAGRSGITRIGSMKPSTPSTKNSPYKLSMVEMRIDGLTNEQMVAFLHGIETSEQMVWIKGVSITRDEKTDGLINMNLKVETIER